MAEERPKIALSDAELESIYYDTETGKHYRRTSASGEFSSSGLKNSGKITEVEINDSSWTELPPSPLSNRNAVSIQNLSGIEMKIGYDENEVGYVGMVIHDRGERFYDIKDTIKIYGKSFSGVVTINVEELS